MAVSFVNSTSTSSGTFASGSTSVVLTMPSGIAAKDLAFVIVSKNNSSTVVPPTGWNSFTVGTTPPIDMQNAGLAYVNLYYRFLDGTESGTQTWSWTTQGFNAAAMVVYRGVDTSLVPPQFSPAFGTASDTTVGYNAITTTAGNAVILYAAGSVLTATTNSITYTEATGTVQRAESGSSRANSNNAGVNFAERTAVVTSPTTVSAISATTNSAANDVTYTIVLYPPQEAIVSGIATSETVPVPVSSTRSTIYPVTIASGETWTTGQPNLKYGNVLYPTPIVTAESVNIPTARPIATATPLTILTQEATGTVTAKTRITATPTTIASTEATPIPVTNTRITATAAGIISTEASGVATAILIEESWGILPII